jgi:hypothetical protein
VMLVIILLMLFLSNVWMVSYILCTMLV